MKGKAYIIGAGPGDEELLTLKAINSLSKCTAVLYDRLVGNNILNYLNDECEIFYCGKEPGCHYKTQEEINDNIVELAKKGHIVGRIKGGDPYVFGRGGEEVLALKKENIPFEVIPGITSPISVLNYGGIPITHRGLSQSFHIVTGMSAKTLNINWEALSKENGTLVFMMGLSNLELIVKKLIENGKSKEVPCAVLMRGTTSKQRKVVGNLENIVKKVQEAKLESPCIIVVGEVVSLNEELDWYEKLPLFGANICITRSKKQSNSLKWKLKELGAEVTEINSIEIKDTSYNLKDYIDNLEKYNYIIFTSINAVNLFFDYLVKNKIDIRRIKGEISALGKATEKALIERGMIPSIVGKSFTAYGLFNELKDNIKKDDEILIPCSSLSGDYLFNELSKLKAKVQRVNIYDTVCGKLKNPRAFSEVDIVLYTSPSTVKNMESLLGREALKEKLSISIGPITSKALNERGIPCKECKIHSEEGFLDEIEEFFREFKN
ncbi:uroporphyrinogen-III C-methyltransferase [Clostridium sp.]|uniref:uroporphyrinogen-III C-methyltransferase n=1 Tax=Clostridium sp. TaxID=1506 RepID=UPI0026321FDB|nr:uroporphyrinogen-III C-methyltransferase [Clostridium sp.]